MKGDQQVIDHLNRVLTSKLTGVNQYLLHARMLENWGLDNLAGRLNAESQSKRSHADSLTQRILFLEGRPNFQDLDQIKVGGDVPEMLGLDMESELEGRDTLRDALAYCEHVKDFASRDILAGILDDTEAHIDWLTQQLRLLGSVGPQNYQQEQMFPRQQE